MGRLTGPVRGATLLQPVRSQPVSSLTSLDRLAWTGLPPPPAFRVTDDGQVTDDCRVTEADVEKARPMTLVFTDLSERNGAANVDRYRASLSLAHAGASRSTCAITLRGKRVQAPRPGHHRPARSLVDGERKAALGDLTGAHRYHEHASGGSGPFTACPLEGYEYQSAQALPALGTPSRD
ncbi:hypothetical protein ACIQNG_05685 [Streptomyces sp. NPDC091377]|uniref:hypothetical protein n=1 Tax=Streptomyces sp. NPDC091377 TaxID=3365995 RepID=UPI00381E18F1